MFFKNVETQELDCLPIIELTILKSCGEVYYLTPEQVVDYTICDDCGALINKQTDDYRSDDTKDVCEDCSNNYYYCEYCGTLLDNEDIIHSKDSDEYSCQDCADRYWWQCGDCGEWFAISDNLATTCDGRSICSDCLENYAYCQDCGELFPLDWLRNDYCEYCLGQNSVIQPHSFKPTPKFYNICTDTTDLYYGFELEVSGSSSCAAEFVDIVNSNDNYIFLKSDSSIGGDDGFEIVTHPMTYNFIQTKFKNELEKGLKYLINEDFKGHNYGGMHIHISRDILTNAQIAIFHKILYIEEGSNNNILLTITQRKEKELEKWANNMSGYLNRLIEKLLNRSYYQSERYKAINLKNCDTIEFRIFNSNLRIERVLKNIEFIKALIDYSEPYKNFTNEEILNNLNNFNYDNLFKFISFNSSQYPNLYNFLLEKELITKQLLLPIAA